jgi:hypothetical protein
MLFLIKYSPKYRELRVLEDRLKETKDELKIASEMQYEDIKTQNPYYRLKIRVDRAAHFVKCAKAQCDLEMEVLAYKDGMHMKAYERYLLDYEMFDNQIEVMITNPPRENQAFTFTTKKKVTQLEDGKWYGYTHIRGTSIPKDLAVYVLGFCGWDAWVWYKGAIHEVARSKLYELDE